MPAEVRRCPDCGHTVETPMRLPPTAIGCGECGVVMWPENE